MALQSGIFDDRSSEDTGRRAGRGHLFWYGATALALAANAVLFVSIHQLGTSINQDKEASAAQIAKLTDLVAQNTEANRQRLDAIAQEARNSANTAEKEAKMDVRKASASLVAKIAQDVKAQEEAERQAQQQMAGQLNELKQASNSTNTKLDSISGDVNGVRGDVRSAQAAIDQHSGELKRMTGDMGVMSGLIATNAKELNELRALGDRNYIEFDLKKSNTMQKIGNIQVQLARSDPKRNRFTLEVIADDKRMEKRDKTVNEPVQMYVAGSRQPCELVVNDVKKDEVKGYLAVPKVTVARR